MADITNTGTTNNTAGGIPSPGPSGGVPPNNGSISNTNVPPVNNNPTKTTPQPPKKDDKAKQQQQQLSTLLSIVKDLNDSGMNLNDSMPTNVHTFLKRIQQFNVVVGELSTAIKTSAKIMTTVAGINLNDKQVEDAKKMILSLSSFNKEILANLVPDLISKKGNPEELVKDIQTSNSIISETNKSISGLSTVFNTLTDPKNKLTKGKMARAIVNMYRLSQFNHGVLESFMPSVRQLGTEKHVYMVQSYQKMVTAIKMMFTEAYGIISILSGDESDLGVDKGSASFKFWKKDFYTGWYAKLMRQKLQRKRFQKARDNIKLITGFLVNDVYKSIVSIKEVASRLGNEKQITQIVKTIEQIKTIYTSIRSIAILMLTLPLFLGLAILVFPILALFMMGFILVSKLLTLLIRFMPLREMMAGFAYLSAVAVAMGICALGFLVVALLADKVLSAWQPILMFLGGMIVLMIIMVIFAKVTMLAMPVLISGLIALGIVTATVLALTIIGLLLMVLVKLKIDKDKVQQAVSDIVTTIGMMILAVFEDERQPNEKGEKPGLFSFIGGVLGKVVAGAGAAIYLVMALFSVAAMILLGRLLKYIKFDSSDSDRIRQAIYDIIDLCKHITNTIMYGTGKRDKGEKADHETTNALGEMISGVFTGITRIVQGIASFGFLIFNLLSVGVLLLLCKLLKYIDFDSATAGKVREAVKNILETIDYIWVQLSSLTNFGSAPTEGGLIGMVLGFFSPQLSGLVNAILTMGTVIFFFVTVALITGLGKYLTTLKDFDMTGIQNAKTNAQKIITSAQEIMDSLFNSKVKQEDKEEGGGLFGWLKDTGKSLFSFVTGSLQILDGLLKIGQVAGLILGISLVTKLANYLQELSEKSKIDGNLAGNVKKMMGTAEQIVDILIASGNRKESHDEVIKKLEDTYSVYDHLGKIVDKVNSIRSDRFEANANAIRSAQDIITSLSKVTDKDVKNNERLANSYVKFIDKVNSADVTKLKTTEKIMENWAKLSQSINGNFDRLADAFTEKLLPVIKELKESLEKIDNTLGHSQEQAASIAAVQLSPGSANSNTITGASAGNSQAQQALEKAKKEAQKSKDKIEDLYRLFEEGEAFVKIKTR